MRTEIRYLAADKTEHIWYGDLPYIPENALLALPERAATRVQSNCIRCLSDGSVIQTLRCV